jgi:ABC-2 type transport system permease protein
MDARANRMQWPSRDGRPMLVQHPAFPIIAMEESAREHAATYQISDAIFPITSTINRKTAPSGARVRVLAKSSEQSWSGTGEAITLEIESMRPTNSKGPFAVMAVIEGRLPSAFAAGGQSTAAGEAPPSGPQSTSRDVRIAVVGSSLLVRDELLGPPERLDENTIAQGLALPMNVVDWLANDRDLIAIRAKSVEDPTLDVPTAVSMAQQDINAAVEARDEEGATAALERGKAALEAWDKKKDLYKYLNWFGIPILFAIFGIIRWRMRLRMKAALAVG